MVSVESGFMIHHLRLQVKNSYKNFKKAFTNNFCSSTEVKRLAVPNTNAINIIREGQPQLHYVELLALATKYTNANNSLSALASHVTIS